MVQYNADSPSGAAYTEVLADLFYDSPPVKEFRKRYHLTRVGGKKHLLGALLKAYKQYGGHKKPNIAILEFRPAYLPGRANSSCSAIFSARKAMRSKSFRRISWSTATRCCAKARSRSI